MLQDSQEAASLSIFAPSRTCSPPPPSSSQENQGRVSTSCMLLRETSLSRFRVAFRGRMATPRDDTSPCVSPSPGPQHTRHKPGENPKAEGVSHLREEPDEFPRYSQLCCEPGVSPQTVGVLRNPSPPSLLFGSPQQSCLDAGTTLPEDFLVT